MARWPRAEVNGLTGRSNALLERTFWRRGFYYAWCSPYLPSLKLTVNCQELLSRNSINDDPSFPTRGDVKVVLISVRGDDALELLHCVVIRGRERDPLRNIWVSSHQDNNHHDYGSENPQPIPHGSRLRSHQCALTLALSGRPTRFQARGRRKIGDAPDARRSDACHRPLERAVRPPIEMATG